MQALPSVHLSREDAMPEGTDVQVMVEQQEIKDIAAERSGVAVPASGTGRARLIDANGGVSVPPVIVVPAEGAAAHTALVQLDVAADQRKRVLQGTPLMN